MIDTFLPCPCCGEQIHIVIDGADITLAPFDFEEERESAESIAAALGYEFGQSVKGGEKTNE